MNRIRIHNKLVFRGYLITQYTSKTVYICTIPDHKKICTVIMTDLCTADELKESIGSVLDLIERKDDQCVKMPT